MGDGKNLKELIYKKGTNVRQLAKATGLKASTLYTIIQKDSHIRFDYGLRIANELGVDVNEVCSAKPFSGEIKEDEIYTTIKDSAGLLDASRVKTYMLYSLYPLMELYGKNAMPDVDNLLTSFYRLNDAGRSEIIEQIRIKLQHNEDPKRSEDVKNIKGW